MNFDNPFIATIRNKIYNRGENALIFFVGKVRSGKSLCNYRFNEIIDPMFNLGRVAFTLDDFYNLVNDDGLYQAAIEVEEMGLKADKREFMRLQNKIITWTFQTFGHKRLCLTMNAPSMAFIDSRIEHLIDYVFETKRAYKRGDKLLRTRFRCYKYQHNPIYGKTYRKIPGFYIDGRYRKVPYWTMGVPSEDKIEEYIKASKRYKDEINVEIKADLDKRREVVKDVAVDEDAILKRILGMKDELASMYKGKLRIGNNKIRGLYPQLSKPKAEAIAARATMIINGVSI